MKKISLILVVFIFTVQLFAGKLELVDKSLNVISASDKTSLCFFEEKIEYTDGYDRQGYDRRGYDKYGYDRAGKDKYGYKKGGNYEVIEIIKLKEYRKDIYPQCIKAKDILKIGDLELVNQDGTTTGEPELPVLMNKNTTLKYVNTVEPVKNELEASSLEVNNSELQLEVVGDLILIEKSKVSYPLYYESGCILSGEYLSGCRLSNGIRRIKQPVLTTVPRITTIRADIKNCGENIPPIYLKITNNDKTANSILLKNNEEINLYKRKGELISEIKIDHYGYEAWTKNQKFPKDCRVSIIIDSNKVDCRNSEADLINDLETKVYIYKDVKFAYEELLEILPAYKILNETTEAIISATVEDSEWLRDNYLKGKMIDFNLKDIITKSRDLTALEEARYQELSLQNDLTDEEKIELDELTEKRIFSLTTEEKIAINLLLNNLKLLSASTNQTIDTIFVEGTDTFDLLARVLQKASDENLQIYKDKVIKYSILIGELEYEIQRVGLELLEAGCIETTIGEDE